MNYLVTRHLGTRQWLKKEVAKSFICMEHIDNPAIFGEGDTIIGTSPISIIFKICLRGARYINIELDIPWECRGKEIMVQQLNEYGVKLVEYHTHIIDADTIHRNYISLGDI